MSFSQKIWAFLVSKVFWTATSTLLKQFAAAHGDVALEIVVDCFHVAKNYRKSVDKVHKKENRRLKSELSAEKYEGIKGIAAYFSKRFNSGFVEGLNNKVKELKRRCCGVLQPTTLFRCLYLDLEGYRRFA